MFLIDTNIAIHLRDRDVDIIMRFAELSIRPALSIISVVELEGGIAARPELADIRRRRLDSLLDDLAVIPFDNAIVASYRRIMRATGFSRRRILDRLIGATAIAHDLTLITVNPDDFRDIPGLKLEAWPAPAQ